MPKKLVEDFGNIEREGNEMASEKEMNYVFIRYIHQTMLNEKINYINRSKKKGIEVVHNESLIKNLQYQNEQLLEQLSEDQYENLEEYINDIDLSNSISKLTNREKFILFKRYVEGQKDPAIAKLLGITSQAVSKQRRNTIKKLKSYFEKGT